MSDVKTERQPKKILKSICSLFLVLGGVLLCGYPFFGELFSAGRHESRILEYTEAVEELPPYGIDEIYEAALKYNENLAGGTGVVTDPFAGENSNNSEVYMQLLRMQGTDVMGFLEIPCINVKLPIYHGTSAGVLEKGVGHLEGTSLPIGGSSVHTVLTGHTGLNRARLFTDLTEMEEGDLFYITAMGRKIAYRVCQMMVVEPTDTEYLSVIQGRDLCTLVTCTPYGINSHRLFVTGSRDLKAESGPESVEAIKEKSGSQWVRAYLVAFGAGLAILLIGALLVRLCRR